MKIRNIKAYIESIIDKPVDYYSLGKDDEYLLTLMFGYETKLSNILDSINSFATNAKEQLFYEFVQNAFDANADSNFFFADKDFLIVLNNGKPFYTDSNINQREGQFYKFLAKGKSDKINDDRMAGAHGQGSKLLYSLLTDYGSNAMDIELLKNAICQQHKGPYIISWGSKCQLDNLLLYTGNWERCAFNDTSNLLFAKIVLGYFPIAPGEYEQFFNDSEAQDVVKAFNSLVDPRRNFSFLSQGTALIIPLGKGRYEEITSKENIFNVKLRLSGFVSLSSSYGKSLKHIYIFGDEIKQVSNTESLQVNFKDEETSYDFQFVFNPEFAKSNIPNMYKYLPIISTAMHYGFLVDSNKNFEEQNGRQDFKDRYKTCRIMKLAYEHLVEELCKLKDADKNKFDRCFQSLLASAPATGKPEDKKFADVFNEVMLPFFAKNAPTIDGGYIPSAQIRERTEDWITVNPSDLGIKDTFWLNPDLADDYKRHFPNSDFNYPLTSLISNSDTDLLKKWILGMDLDTYSKFQSECFKNKSKIAHIPVFLSDNGNIRSWNELSSSANIYYLANDIDKSIFVGQELSKLCLKNGSEYRRTLFSKIDGNIELLRETPVGINFACNVLAYIESGEQPFRVKTLPVLRNQKGEFVSFNDLPKQRPQGTILFDRYLPQGSVPPSVSDWLINIDFNWICDHFEELKEEPGWGENTEKYLSDIKKVYDADKSTDKQDKQLNLYLDSDGMPIKTKCYAIKNYKQLTQKEYSRLCEEFDYNIVPYDFKDLLTTAPFHLDNISASDFIGDNCVGIDYQMLEILVKIYGKREFLNKYHIEEEQSDSYAIKQYGNNYINHLGSDLVEMLEQTNFYHIPDSVQKIFTQEILREYDINNEKLAEKLVEDITKRLPILPIIKNCSTRIKKLFFEKLEYICIDEHIDKDSDEWKVIQFAVKEDFKDDIFEKILYNNEPLPSSSEIQPRIQTYNGTEYDLYKLDSDYEENNSRFDDFKALLPDSDWFEKEFYSDTDNDFDWEALYSHLCNYYLSIYQFEFCLEYALNEHKKGDILEPVDDVPLSDILDFIRDRIKGGDEEYKNFENYYSIPGFDRDIQVFANKKLLTENELLPQDLFNWIDDNKKDYKEILGKIRTESDPFIKIRKTIESNKTSDNVPALDSSRESEETINWLCDNDIRLKLDSDGFKTALKFVNNTYKQNKNLLIGLRYKEVTDSEIIFQFSDPTDCDDILFMRYKDGFKNKTFQDLLENDNDLQQKFSEACILIFDERYDLIKDNQILKISDRPIEGKYEEIVAEAYSTWKESKESDGYSIKTSPDTIVKQFCISVQDNVFFEKNIGDENAVLNSVDKTVIVKCDSNSDISLVLKVIRECINDLRPFQQPFIALQAVYMEYLEKHLKLVKVNWDYILKILKKKEKPNDISGLLGEFIYDGYLKKLGTESEYSAEKGIGAYDFHNLSKNIYIDIKTSETSLKDDAIPFYLHKSSVKFLRNNQVDFRVLNISIPDIGLWEEYSNLKKEFGKLPSSSLRKNPKFRNECRRIAEDYWKTASTDSFKEACPEYKLEDTIFIKI